MKTVACLIALAGSAHADSKAWTSGKAVIASDANIVGGVSASSVRNSGLYQQWLPLLLSQAGEAKTALDAIQKECSIDILSSIDSVAFGIDDNKAGAIIIALKGTNHKALDACAQKLAKADKKTVEITTEGKLTKYAGMGDKAIYLDWLASDVFAVSTSADDKDQSVKLLAGGVTSNKAMKTPLAKLDKSASLWFVINKEQPLDTGKLEQIYGTASVANKKISVAGHVVTDSASTATTLSATATKKLADAQATASKAVQAAIGSVSLKTSGAEIIASAAVAEDDVVALVTSMMH